MVITKKLQNALNGQINAELYSSYLYLSMAAYFEAANWPGFAAWMKMQSQEEYSHAMKLYTYLVERGGRVELAAIKAPRTEWKSTLDVFEDVYGHELKVTGLIHALMTLAQTEDDHATVSYLKWFVDEQVEEEANASLIVEQLKRIKDSMNGLFMLDHKLGERK